MADPSWRQLGGRDLDETRHRQEFIEERIGEEMGSYTVSFISPAGDYTDHIEARTMDTGVNTLWKKVPKKYREGMTAAMATDMSDEAEWIPHPYVRKGARWVKRPITEAE